MAPNQARHAELHAAPKHLPDAVELKMLRSQMMMMMQKREVHAAAPSSAARHAQRGR